MRIGTLFTGGGGVDIGARMAGIEHAWGVEYDAAIADVARANGIDVLTADVRDVDYTALAPVDILHASPPCPNFSVAKTQRGETETDRAIAAAVCRAIRETMPRVFTLENVRGYAGAESLQQIGDTLMALDYAVETFVVNAADYGVPQTRERLFLVARRGGWMRAPLLLPRKTRWIGWYEAIADLLDTLPPSQFAPWQLARLPAELRAMLGDTSTTPITDEERAEGAMTAEEREEWEDRTWRESVMSVVQGANSDVCAIDAPAPTIAANHGAAKYRAFIVDGTSDMAINVATEPAQTVVSTVHSKAAMPRAFLVEGRNPNGGSDVYGDMPAQTVSTSHPPRAAVHGRVVAMTPRALARFQSFPDEYVLPEKKSLACRVIGNAVPPRLYAAIIGAVLEQM